MPYADLVFTGGPVFTANTVRSRAGAGDRKWRFCQIAPPTVLGMPTK